MTVIDDGGSISGNAASLNILVHDVINLLYYDHWTNKQTMALTMALVKVKASNSSENLQNKICQIIYFLHQVN